MFEWMDGTVQYAANARFGNADADAAADARQKCTTRQKGGKLRKRAALPTQHNFYAVILLCQRQFKYTARVREPDSRSIGKSVRALNGLDDHDQGTVVISIC